MSVQIDLTNTIQLFTNRLFSTNIELQEDSLIFLTYKKLQDQQCDIELHLTLKEGENTYGYVLGETTADKQRTYLTPLRRQQQHMINSAWFPVTHTGWVTW